LRREQIRHLDEAGEIPAVSRCLPFDRAPLRAGEAALGPALDDVDGALQIVRGLPPIALPEVEPGEVVEGAGDPRVLRTERLLVYGKGALVERLGLGVAAWA
jgi:hypothetical protein